MYLRNICLLCTVVVGTSSLNAQSPTQPPAQPGQTRPGTTQQQPPPVQSTMTPEQVKALEGILGTWESDAKSLQSLYITFAITEENPIFKSTTMSYGEAKVLRMANGQYGLKLEIYDLDRAGKPDPTKLKRKFVCSGTWLYNFDIPTKIIYINKLQNQNMRPDDGPFAFLFGMKAVEARKRFDISFVQQDDHYVWLKVTPLTAQDQREFKVAQLGIVKYANAISPKDFPLKIMWREPGESMQTWDFKSVVRNDLNKVSMMDFTVENEKRQGWQIKEAPAQSSQQPPTGQPNQVLPTGGSVPRK